MSSSKRRYKQHNAMLNTGQILQGRYQVIQKIAEGGQVSVFQAADLNLGSRRVALRMLKTQHIPHKDIPQLLQQFKHTCDLLAPLSHPNVIKIYDSFVEGDAPCAVTEYILGQTLEDWAKRYPNGMPEAFTIQAGIVLCQALGFLHQQRPAIIHRDIKPENIMMTPNGDLKLIDFGIARQWSTGKMRDTVAIGTQGYAPPEQYGSSQTGAYSDLYALGATLLRLSTGFDPNQAQVGFNLPIACQIKSSVSQGLSGVIVKATKLAIAERFQSSGELARALSNPVPFVSYATQLVPSYTSVPPLLSSPYAPTSPHMASVPLFARNRPEAQAILPSPVPAAAQPFSVTPTAFVAQPNTNQKNRLMIGLTASIFLCGCLALMGVLLYREMLSPIQASPTVVIIKASVPATLPTRNVIIAPTLSVFGTVQLTAPTSTAAPTRLPVASQPTSTPHATLIFIPVPTKPPPTVQVGNVGVSTQVASPSAGDNRPNLGNNRFSISSTQGRQYTGIYAPLGANIRITQVGGQWRNARDSPYTGGNGYPEAGDWSPNPMPDHPPGMLICWIGDVPVAVRQGIAFYNRAQGQISCQMNDDILDDNSGSLVIEILIGR